MKYQRKPGPPLDAIKFEPKEGQAPPDGVEPDMRCIGSFVYRARRGLAARTRIHPGDWLVTALDGSKFTVTSREFHETYQEVGAEKTAKKPRKAPVAKVAALTRPGVVQGEE